MISSRCSRFRSAPSQTLALVLFGITLFSAFGLRQAQAQRPTGIDVSDYQPNLNWTSVKTSGVSFAWAKATEGLTGNESTFAGHMASAKANGVLIGAYHFAHPENNTPASEAAHFWGVASNYIVGGGVYMMPMLDFEVFTTTVGASSYTDWYHQWCTIISNNAAASGITLKFPLYVSACHACNYDNSVSQYTPWIACYNGQNPQTGTPWSTCVSCSDKWGTGVWKFWQYTGTGTQPGNVGDTDLDVFNGTAAGLAAHVIGTNTSPPSIISQPSNRVGDRGGSVKFRVNVPATVIGPAPKYQWRLNGANIPGATVNPYTVSNIQTNNAGSYTVVVTNVHGAVTSSVATLTVNPLFVPVFSDNFDTNSSANWTVTKSSATDTRVTFAYDYTSIGVPSAPNSVGGTKKGLRLEANLSNSVVSALSLSPVGKSFVGDYRLHFDMWINVNGPLPGGGAGSTEEITAGVGTTGGKVQWTGAGSTADGVWFSMDGEGGVGDTSTTQGDFVAYIGTAAQAASTGVYAAGTATSARGNTSAYYENVFPTGYTPPASQTAAYTKQEGGLAVGTLGLAWHDVVVNKSGGTVQWYIDGLRIATVSAATIVASNITVGYWDPFTSLSDNTNLSFGLIDNLRVEVPAVGPSFLTQPADLAVKVASNVTFTASATGVPSPSYQWKFNDANIAGATGTNFTITNVQYTNAGSYSVVVSNIAGIVTSTNALLSIITPSPATFTSYSVMPDQSLQLAISGDADTTYYVQSSTNLVDWITFTNVTITGNIVSLNVGSTTNSPQLYFRASTGP